MTLRYVHLLIFVDLIENSRDFPRIFAGTVLSFHLLAVTVAFATPHALCTLVHLRFWFGITC